MLSFFGPTSDFFFKFRVSIRKRYILALTAMGPRISGLDFKFLDGRSLNVQATEYSDGETLLFVWADAGDTGLTGNEVAMSTIRAISEDVKADYNLVEN